MTPEQYEEYRKKQRLYGHYGPDQSVVFNTEEKLTALEKNLVEIYPKAANSRTSYLEAKAKKNYYEKKLEDIEQAIYEIRQGQMCFGDMERK